MDILHSFHGFFNAGDLMKYKINEVSQITGVPVDTLRYYEKIGVISPKIDDNNHYRYYEAWDINFIFDYTNYRKLEYSSRESLNFIHGASLEEQLAMLQTKQHYYQSKIEHYTKLKGRNDKLLAEIQGLCESLNHVTMEQAPAYLYIPYRKNYDFHGFKEYKEELNEWLGHLEMTDNVIMVDKDCALNQGENTYHWGLMVQESDFRATGLRITDNVRRIPEGLCVKIVIQAGGAGTFHYSLLEPAFKFIKEHNFTLAGDPYGILWIRSHEGEQMHRYFAFYLPVE